MVKDRCIGAFDLESPELNAFTKRHVELLTLLAAEAAVAIENARLWEAVNANEARLEKELRFAQRVQMALLPKELPKRLRTVDVAWRFEPARELGGDLFDFLAPEPNQLIVAVGDVSGKGVPAALYSVFAGEVVRGRTFRKRVTKEQGGPGMMLTSINRILHERQLEEYYCTLCYAQFDLRQHLVTLANSGSAVPDPLLGRRIDVPADRAAGRAARIVRDDQLRRGRRPRPGRRRVRVLQRRHLRDLQRDRCGVRIAAHRRGRARPPRQAGQGHRRGDLRGDERVPRQRAADRRPDGAGREDRWPRIRRRRPEPFSSPSRPRGRTGTVQPPSDAPGSGRPRCRA